MTSYIHQQLMQIEPGCNMSSSFLNQAYGSPIQEQNQPTNQPDKQTKTTIVIQHNVLENGHTLSMANGKHISINKPSCITKPCYQWGRKFNPAVVESLGEQGKKYL